MQPLISYTRMHVGDNGCQTLHKENLQFPPNAAEIPPNSIGPHNVSV